VRIVRKLHVASWNVEGITRRALPEVLARLGSPDVLCLQELRLRERDAEEVRALASALPGYAFHHSLADDPKNARFRGGRTYGVGTFVRTALEPIFVARPAWDREGRTVVSVVRAAKLAIVNVYAVNGTDKPYWSHDLGAYEGDRHGYKMTFHTHVAELARTLRDADLDLLLIGDWNVSQERIDTSPRLRTEEPHATTRAHFRDTVVRDLDVVDVFRATHPDARAYTWFNMRARARGRLDAARVDFALLSRNRVKDVRAASIDESLLDALGSDHAPLHVELAF
jgi:exodeoxyribonuclease-3